MKWTWLKHRTCSKTSSFLPVVLLWIVTSTLLAVVDGAGTPEVSSAKISTGKPKVRRNRQRNSKSTANPILSTKEEILAEVSETVYISCSLNKTIVHGCQWFKSSPQSGNRKRITQFFDRYQSITSCEFQIRSVTYEDAGMYICEGFNEASEPTVHTSQLTVTGEDDPFGNTLFKPSSSSSKESVAYSEPEIEQETFSIDHVYRVHKGDNIVLQCKARGNPTPVVSWRRGSKLFTDPTEGYSSLKLTNLTNEDSGTYKCEATNLFGKAVQEVTLQVRGAQQGSSEILDVTPRNVTLYEGNEWNVTCIARFEGDPWFGWVKKIDNNTGDVNTFRYEGHDYAVLQRTEIRPIGQQLYATTLLLQNVTTYHSGIYHCIVAGLQGYNHSEAYVVVEKVPLKLTKSQWSRGREVAIVIFAFIILSACVILCILRVYGCPHPGQNNKKKLSSQSSLQSHSSSMRKTQLPKRSPETLSTDCTHHPHPHYRSYHPHSSSSRHPDSSAFHPLVTHGSCSLGSQEPSLHFRDCTSSCGTSYNCYDDEISMMNSSMTVGGEGLVGEEDSSFMADLEAARSSYSRAGMGGTGGEESFCDTELCSKQSLTSLGRTQTSDYCPRQYQQDRKRLKNYLPANPQYKPGHHKYNLYHPVKTHSSHGSSENYIRKSHTPVSPHYLPVPVVGGEETICLNCTHHQHHLPHVPPPHPPPQGDFSSCQSYEPSNLSTLSVDCEETMWNTSQASDIHRSERSSSSASSRRGIRHFTPNPNFTVLEQL